MIKEKFFLVVGAILLSSEVAFATVALNPSQNPIFQCDPPHWTLPGESNQGTFRGELAMKCHANPSYSNPGFEAVRDQIIRKIHSESIVHEGPLPIQIESLKALRWDVTQKIQEEDSAIVIREKAILGTDLKQRLLYETHSSKVTATGMASYLRLVNFSMDIVQKRNNADSTLTIEFKNQVEIERPWYALDLLFAPIARKTCFQKMTQIQNKLLPWVASALYSQK